MEVRVRLRPWLESRLNEGWIEGFCWIDKEKGIFKIPWKHHSKHTWTEEDAAIFKDWAVVTGRYRAGIDDPDWPMWKTRLRCALNKAPDIQEVRQRHDLHCDEPFKVYRFISKTESLWRANATRNASMIFDGISPVNKLSLPHSQHATRLECAHQSVSVPRRTAVFLQRLPGAHKSPRSLTLVNRRNEGIFLKQLPFVQTQPNGNENLGHRAYQSQTFGVGPSGFECVDPVSYSSASRLMVHSSVSVPATVVRRLGTPSATAQSQCFSALGTWGLQSSSFLPDIMEPEYHQLGVRIQHLNVRVKDAIITNPNGCCIYFGRYDEINSPAAPDPVEAQIPHHVSEANKEYVDLLLDNMVRGIILSATQGNIYAERMCKCAAFVYVPTSNGEYVLLKKLGRRERELIFDYNEFMISLRLHFAGQRPKPHFEVILAFGQQLRPNLTTSSLLVWCRVASCRAWFQLHKQERTSLSISPETFADEFPLNRGLVSIAADSDPGTPYNTPLISRSDLLIINRENSGYLAVNSDGKLSELDRVLDHDVTTIGLTDPLEHDMIRGEQVIEEAVEVPLDDQDESLVYDTSSDVVPDNLLVTDAHDTTSSEVCISSSSLPHDVFFTSSSSIDVKPDLSLTTADVLKLSPTMV
ncbi:hypothetical protein P879_09329 [Paragonimus westermani]|uniref:IRF tryptophan pentad repeat domain-containing protein n=1 Tax=Paragonimus westermani TaxID=34504 RepID=A0A8T0DEZ7_9TREM|nr:hypothetical protein P879_09329 [Paragonimus westermani]